jgi:hypothetical protein
MHKPILLSNTDLKFSSISAIFFLKRRNFNKIMTLLLLLTPVTFKLNVEFCVVVLIKYYPFFF